ncbi:hypothetical protein QAD02_023458 [Eretmocerus hayati]|uniref:Uncharacterized protein n=1 Tax=Eretmocerus hayati TaxID=131215 RepID=A0ACC2PYD3_9HYME|nr:hypothetical protein QAD02_023458 [Eretmocerus hayati]
MEEDDQDFNLYLDSDSEDNQELNLYLDCDPEDNQDDPGQMIHSSPNVTTCLSDSSFDIVSTQKKSSLSKVEDQTAKNVVVIMAPPTDSSKKCLQEDTLRIPQSEEVTSSGHLLTLGTASIDLDLSSLIGEYDVVSSECIKSTPKHVLEDVPMDIDVVPNNSASATGPDAETNPGLKVNLKRFVATSTCIEVDESSGGSGPKRQRSSSSVRSSDNREGDTLNNDCESLPDSKSNWEKRQLTSSPGGVIQGEPMDFENGPEMVRSWDTSTSDGNHNLSHDGPMDRSYPTSSCGEHDGSLADTTNDSSNNLIIEQHPEANHSNQEDPIFQDMINPQPKVPLPDVEAEPEDIIASQQKVEFSNAKKFYAKDNFCSLCNTMQNRIDRHLTIHHAEIEGVKIINSLPKGSLERRQKFGEIVKSMNFVWNTDRTINPEGHIIPTRRRRAPKPGSETTCKVASMIVCTHCLGFYARGSLHNHIRIQHPDKMNPNARTRVNAMRGKAMMKLCHERANLNEISELLAELDLDEPGAVARYDLLIILYANKFGAKHRTKKQRVYVRNNMRLLARILIAAKKINGNIKDLASLLRVEHREVLRDAIEAVAVIDHKTKRYGSIYNAEAAPIVIRKLFVILKAEYLSHKSTKDDHTDIVNFIDVFENEVAFLISYRAAYSRKEQM